MSWSMSNSDSEVSAVMAKQVVVVVVGRRDEFR